eukprot:11156806-Lingulodinium_polyedra.AAC.1
MEPFSRGLAQAALSIAQCAACGSLTGPSWKGAGLARNAGNTTGVVQRSVWERRGGPGTSAKTSSGRRTWVALS